MLNKIMYMTSYKMQAEESMRRIDMILTAEPQAETSAPKHPKTYDVSFEDVTFTYENTDHPAVSHLSFTAKAGTTTALVGHSGSGKSTTASLIPVSMMCSRGRSGLAVWIFGRSPMLT